MSDTPNCGKRRGHLFVVVSLSLSLSLSPSPSLSLSRPVDCTWSPFGRTRKDGRDGGGVVFQAKNPLVINRRGRRRRGGSCERRHVASPRRRRASRIAPDIDRQIEWVVPAQLTMLMNMTMKGEGRDGGRRSRTPVAAGRLNYSDPQTKQNGHIFGVKVDFLGFWDLMGSAYLEIQARGARTGAGGAARRGGRYAR